MSNGTDSAAVLAATLSDRSLNARMGVTRANFLRAAFWTALIVFVFWCGYQIERNVLHRGPANIRYIREASEAAMRYITIPHIVIGFLFLVSSKNNRSTRQRLWTVGLLAAGAGLCVLYRLGGGPTDVVLSAGVYFYFLVHELRDEAMFYTVLGEAAPIPDKAAFRRFVRAMIALIIVSLAVVVIAPASFGIYAEKLRAKATGLASLQLAETAWLQGSLPLPVKIACCVLPIAAVAAGYAVVLRKYARVFGYADVKSFAEAHAKLFFVMFGVAAVLGMALLLTQRAYSLILFHVVAWYIFASYQFTRYAPKEKPTGLLTWMRTTTAGFRTLHIGMAAALMILGLVWTLGMNQHAALAWLLAPESFLYWTLMHITVSFVPR